MHNAPAVNYPVGRSRFQAWLLGLTGFGGIATGLLWRYQVDLAPWRQWLFAVALLGAFILAADAWRRSPSGLLRWDGQAWSWNTADTSATGVLAVHLDLPFCMLLSLRADAGARMWLWPQRSADAGLWNALRRAVFSRSGSGQGRGASDAADWAHR